VLFEFDVMKGSESEDYAEDFLLPGTFVVEEDGTGTWEEETEAGKVSVRFVLEGQTVTVTQKGNLPLSVAGIYTWLEPGYEVTAETAGELVEGLATAATSLNSNNGAYRLEFSDVEVDDWFYDLKALFEDSGELIGEFLIARDLSAVYRIDTDLPMLIFGAADAMMQAVHEVIPEEGEVPATVSQPEGGTDSGEELPSYVVPLVDAVPSTSQLKVGETAKVVPVTPGNVPATLICTSKNPDVASVDESGTLTGIAPGTAVITGTLTVDGVEKPFLFEVDVWSPAIMPLNILASVPVGGSVTMQARPVGVEDSLRWSVSDASLAEVDAETGVFKGLKAGEVLLAAQAGDLKREWKVRIGEGTAMEGLTETVAPSESAEAVDAAGEEEPENQSGLFILVGSGAIILAGAGLLGFLIRKRRKIKSAK